jgi:hypothetical protein
VAESELPFLSLGEIAARLRERPEGVASWVDPGVKDPAGRTVRLVASRAPGVPGGYVVRPEDLVRFIRARYGLPEPEFAR